jgi:hypothetical protein
MVYRCKKFDSLSDLTQFLNENDICKNDVIYIGPELTMFNSTTNRSNVYCLIYFERGEY